MAMPLGKEGMRSRDRLRRTRGALALVAIAGAVVLVPPSASASVTALQAAITPSAFAAELAAINATTAVAQAQGWRTDAVVVDGTRTSTESVRYDPIARMSLELHRPIASFTTVMTRTGVGFWINAVDGYDVPPAVVALLGRRPDVLVASPDSSADAAQRTERNSPANLFSFASGSGMTVQTVTRQDEPTGARAYHVVQKQVSPDLVLTVDLFVDAAGRLSAMNDAFETYTQRIAISYGRQGLSVPQGKQLVTPLELETAKEALALPMTVKSAAQGIAIRAKKAAQTARRAPTVADVRRAIRRPVGVRIRVSVVSIRGSVRVTAKNPYTGKVSVATVTVVKRRVVIR